MDMSVCSLILISSTIVVWIVVATTMTVLYIKDAMETKPKTEGVSLLWGAPLLLILFLIISPLLILWFVLFVINQYLKEFL